MSSQPAAAAVYHRGNTGTASGAMVNYLMGEFPKKKTLLASDQLCVNDVL